MISRNSKRPSDSRRAKAQSGKARRNGARPAASAANSRSPRAVDLDARALELWEQRFAALRAREDAGSDVGLEEETPLDDRLNDLDDAINALDPSSPCAAAGQLMIAGLFDLADGDRPKDCERMRIALKGLAGLRVRTRGRIRADVDEILDNPERPVVEMGVLGADTDERRRAVRRDRVERLIEAAWRKAKSAGGDTRDERLIALGHDLMTATRAREAAMALQPPATKVAAFDNANSAAWVAAVRIAEAPAAGLAGLAIKACVFQWARAFTAIDLTKNVGSTLEARLLTSIVRDAMRQV